MLVLLALQVFLGALTIWSLRAVVPTTAHVATGALLFVTSVVFAIRITEVTGGRRQWAAGDSRQNEVRIPEGA